MNSIKMILLVVNLCGWFLTTEAQVFTTLKGTVTFDSEAPLENITAINKQIAAQVDFNQTKGQIIIPIQNFSFKIPLMEEHFNENYLESEKYPKATYKFTIKDLSSVVLDQPGSYPVHTTGILTIKNKSQQVHIPGTIEVIDSKTIRIKSTFTISPEDYGIKIPKLVRKKIAERVKISVNSTLKNNK